MSGTNWLSGTPQLKNTIPYDGDSRHVAVQFAYDEATDKFYPVNYEDGSVIANIGARSLSYELMHDSITTASGTVPTSPLALFDFTGYPQMIVDVKLSGSSSATLTPIVWNPINAIYQLGTPQSFTTNQRAVVNIFGASDVYLLPT